MSIRQSYFDAEIALLEPLSVVEFKLNPEIVIKKTKNKKKNLFHLNYFKILINHIKLILLLIKAFLYNYKTLILFYLSFANLAFIVIFLIYLMVVKKVNYLSLYFKYYFYLALSFD